MAEFHVHGSRAVVNELHLSLLSIKNVDLRTLVSLKLAFLNGRIILTQAEGIGDLISSETEIQMEQALKYYKVGLFKV